MKKQINLAVLGAGNMGTAVAKVLAENGHLVKIWNWEGDLEPLKDIAKHRENKKYLPGMKLPANIVPAYKIVEAVEDADIVFLVIPSGVMEHTISFAARSIPKGAIIVDVSKGIEPHSLQLIPTVIAKHVRPALKGNIVTISGPAIAGQMAKRQYTAMNVASKNRKAIRKVIEVMENNYIKLVPTSDVIGVEVGGSFKNVYTIAMGICDAMGYGLNTKAALIVYAIEEIANLIKAMGGRKHTAYELAGLGDLIGTSLCKDSRNRTFGECLGGGLKSCIALKQVKQTVEGIDAAKCLMRLSEKYKVRLPFAEMIYKCITDKEKPRTVMKRFLENLK